MRLSAIFTSVAALFMASCAFQPPSLETGSRFNGTFAIEDASGGPQHFQSVKVAISGSVGVAYLMPSNAGTPELDLDLTRCTVLDSGTVDALSWKTSFLGGQDAEVIRCVATSAKFASRFAIARAEQPLDYHPPVLAKLMTQSRDVHAGSGRLLFLWGGSATSAYALAPANSGSGAK